MSDRSPAFRFYAKDWRDVKVRRLSLAAQGAYITILADMWADSKDQCSILASDPSIARGLGIAVEEWFSIKKEIQNESEPLFLEKDGRFFSKRLAEERDKQLNYAKSQAESGRRGGLAKGKRASSEPLASLQRTSSESVANTLAKPSSSSSLSSSSLSSSFLSALTPSLSLSSSSLSSAIASLSEKEEEREEVKTPREVKKPSRGATGEAKSSRAWEAYSQAYHDRYHVTPQRNQKVNSGLCQLVNDIGAEAAPLVARFYLSHPGRFYVEHLHPVNLMVRDSQKLLTEYNTGQVMTSTQARQEDGKATRGQMWQRLIDKETKKETV